MADIKKTIEIIFAGVDKLSPTIEDVGGGLSKVGQGVSQATQPLADLSDNILLTSAAITALGVAALAFATGEAIKLENSFIELNKVLGESEGTATDYADAFGDISNKFGIGQADIISLAADFKQAGFTIDESLGLVTDALTAAATSELSVDQAGDSVIRTLNGFQAPASEAGRLIDIVANAANKFALNATELSTGLSRLSPIAKQVGFSFEETVGLLTPVIEVFGSGSEAANGLRTALLSLASDSKPVTDALESIGIDTSEVVTAKDRLKALSDVFPKLTEARQLNIAADIAGKEQAAKFILVLKNQEQVLNATKEALNSSGAAAKELSIALGSTEVALSRFKNSFVNIGAAIGSEFLPQLGKVADSATALNEAVLASLSGDNFQQVFDALRGVFTALDEEIQGIAKAFPDAIKQVDFSPILDGLDEVSGALGSIFDNIDLTTPEGLAKAIQLVVDSLGSIAQVTAGIIQEFEGVFDIVGQSIDAFNNLTEEEKQATGQALGFGKIMNEVGGILESVGSAVEGIGIALSVLIGASGLSAVGTLFTSLTSVLGKFSIASGVTAASAGALSISVGSIAASAAALAIPITALIGLFAELNDQSISKFIDDISDFSGKQEFAAQATENFGSTVGNLSQQLANGEIDLAQYRQQMAELSDQQILTKFATMENTEANRENVLSLLKTVDAIDEFKKGSSDAVAESDKLTESLTGVAEKSEELSFEERNAELIAAAKAMGEASKSSDELAGSLGGNKIAVDNFGNALTVAGEKASKVDKELTSIDGKDVTVKVTAETLTAQQNLEKFQSVLGSLDNQISSTGDTVVGLGDLFSGNFNNLDPFSQSAIRKAFESEISSRQKALDLQNRLIETEVRLQEARLKAIEKGGSNITIDTTGIEPILDLLLTTIIEQAQMKASVEGAAFLVGAL